VGRGERWGGGGPRRGPAGPAVHGCDQPGRDREPDRAPGVGGGSREPHAARPAAALDRVGARGGPGRRSGPGAPRRYSLVAAAGSIRRSARLAAAAISSLISSSIIFLSLGTAALAAGPISPSATVTGKRTEASESSSASTRAGTAGAAAGPSPEIS